MSGWSPGLCTRQSLASEESPGCACHVLACSQLQQANIYPGAALLSSVLCKLDGGAGAVTVLLDGCSPHARLSAISQSPDEFFVQIPPWKSVSRMFDIKAVQPARERMFL